MRPSKKTLREAADLMACLASQPESWPWFIDDLPIHCSPEVRATAELEWASVRSRMLETADYLPWRQCYAEAEASIRKRLETM